jgi:hypothetical protein
VDQTLSDDLLGRHYRIVSYVPSIPVPADFAEAYPVYAGATLVALEVELTVDPDTPYATAAHPFDLTLHCGSTDAPESAANTLLTEVYADQFPPAASAEPGATTSGWIGFRTVNQCGGAPYTVVARRQGSDRVRGRPGRAGQSGDKEPPDQASLPYAEFTLELPPAPAG